MIGITPVWTAIVLPKSVSSSCDPIVISIWHGLSLRRRRTKLAPQSRSNGNCKRIANFPAGTTPIVAKAAYLVLWETGEGRTQVVAAGSLWSEENFFADSFRHTQ